MFKEARSIYQALLDGSPILRAGKSEEKEEAASGATVKSEPGGAATAVAAAEKKTKKPKKKGGGKNLGGEEALVYIQLMKFARRCESLESARKVFLQARKRCTTHHAYLAAAMMEHRQNKVATKRALLISLISSLYLSLSHLFISLSLFSQ